MLLPALVLLHVLTSDPLQRAQLTVGVVFLPVFFFAPLTTLFALLTVRPVVDAYGGATLALFDRIPLNPASLLSIAVLAWGVLVLLRYRLRIWQKPLFWPMVFVLAAALPGFVLGAAPAATLREFVRLATVFLVAQLSGALVTTPARFRAMRAVLAASLVIPASIAAVQFFTHTGLTFGSFSNRVYGSFGHPNVFAFYLVFLLVVFLPVLLLRPRPRPWWVWATAGTAAVLLLLTYTRGAWVGLLLTLGIIGAVRYRRLFLRAMFVLVLLALLAPFVHRTLLETSGVDLTRTQIVRRVLDLERESDDSSIEFRVRLWREMSRKFAEQPVFGHGLGAFPVLREQQIRGFFQATEAHNDYLRLAIETGILGLVAYGTLLATLLRNLLRARGAKATPEQRVTVLCALAFLPAFLFMSFFDNLLQGTAVMWAFWAYMSAVAGMQRGALPLAVPKG